MNAKQIRSHPLLRDLPGSVYRRLMENAVLAVHPKGETLFRKGDPCTCCYLILSGRCEISPQTAPLSAANTAALTASVNTPPVIRGPGDSLGERDVLHNYAHFRNTARVITDSLLLCIEAPPLQKLVTQKPRLSLLINQYLNQTLQEQQQAPPAALASSGRVASLVSFSPDLPVSHRTAALADALADYVAGPILVIQLCASGGVPFRDWHCNEHTLGGDFHFADDLEVGQHHTTLKLTFETEATKEETDCIAALLGHAAEHFQHILLAATAGELPPGPLAAVMQQSDACYLLLRSDPAALSVLRPLIHEAQANTDPAPNHFKPVLWHRPGERCPGFAQEFEAQTGLHVHAHVHEENFLGVGNVGIHTRRLAREIARCRVGLALSTGGACGLAHVGVLKALAENGIEVDMVAGASMGAYIAAIWGCGFDADHMETLAKQLEGRWGVLKLIDPALSPRKGFIRGRRARRRLEQSIRDSHFSDLPHPIRVVATRLDTLEHAVFERGRVSTAVQASISMPATCVPVTIDGISYTDGGVSNPLPVDILKQEGIETVIAVNTILTSEEIRRFRRLEAEQAVTNPARRSKSPGFFSRHLNYFAPGNMLDTVLRGFQASQMRIADQACDRADVVLRVNNPDDTWYEFHHPEKYIEAGRIIAEEHMDEIKAHIRRHRHDHKSTGTQMGTAA